MDGSQAEDRALEFLRGRGHSVELATYDDRLIGAARALDIRLLRL